MTRIVSLTYVSLCAATVTVAVATRLAGFALMPIGPPHDALRPGVGTMLELAAHNATVLLWPLGLVLLRWPEYPGARNAADALVAWQVAAHAVLIGNALGQRPELWRYLPHLPAEWLALSIPAAAWIRARRAAGASAIGVASASAASVLVAAGVETWVVPV